MSDNPVVYQSGNLIIAAFPGKPLSTYSPQEKYQVSPQPNQSSCSAGSPARIEQTGEGESNEGSSLNRINCMTPYLISGQRLKLLHPEQDPSEQSLHKEDSNIATELKSVNDKRLPDKLCHSKLEQ